MDTSHPRNFIGKPLDGLPLNDRWALANCWVATRLYSPEILPLRIIDAIGRDAADCINQLRQRGMEPTQFHYELLTDPYEQPKG